MDMLKFDKVFRRKVWISRYWWVPLAIAFSWGEVGRWLKIGWMYLWASSPFGGGGGGGF